MGRKKLSDMSPEELARERARKREQYARYKQRNLSKEQDRFVTASRKYRAANIEKVREADRARKAKEREESKNEVNQYNRENYASDPNGAEKQRNRRYRREPNRIIRAATKLFESGDLSRCELTERIDEAVALADKIIIES